MSKFALDIRKFSEKAGKNADLVVRKVCSDIEAGVVKRTPVDTGRLRANWIASVGNAYEGQVSGTGNPNNEQAIRNAPGNVWYLTNNLPYAAVAEFGLYGKPPGSANGPKTKAGYSTQAPAGMVRITIAAVKSSLMI